MARLGKRAAVPLGPSDEVIAVIKDVTHSARILKLVDGDKAIIKSWNDKKKYKIPVDRLTRRTIVDDINADMDEDDDMPTGNKHDADPNSGIPYPINWDLETTNFATRVNGIKFYGWWRKRGWNSFAIDMFAKMPDESEVACECIQYYNQDDPREEMRKLNMDICTAINKFLHFAESPSGKAGSIVDLHKKATSPMIRINRLNTIDSIIMRLKEFRDIAIRCGGRRFFVIEGDRERDPKPVLSVMLTDQALALKGKVPDMYRGAIVDAIAHDGGVVDKEAMKKYKGDPKNIQALIEQLKAAKKRGDETEQRKIRAVLRKLGHKGGAKSVKA